MESLAKSSVNVVTRYNPRTNLLARRKTLERFINARKKGKVFTQRLKAVAHQIDNIIRGFAPTGIVEDVTMLQRALEQYGALIQPWAASVSEQLIAEINQRDEQAWFEMAREIGRSLRTELLSAPMRPTMRQLQQEQIELITSLPREASNRVHNLAIESYTAGTRADVLSQKILETGEVTLSRAKLIARTEIARTAATLNETRARHIGAETFIWRTSHDGDVREEHKELDGKVFRYDEPPVAARNGTRALPGCIWNCRCYADPIIPF